MKNIKNIVLVHGFWLDASCYREIIPALQSEGYEVFAVQNPLTSLPDDVAAVRRVFDRLDGKCILVGHSWGGIVITEAGNDERVAGLVYIAGLAPDVNESMFDLMVEHGASPSPHFQEKDGFIWISREGVQTIFADDLPAAEAAFLYATQNTPSVSLTEAKITSPAWKDKPSWYIVADKDKAVLPNLQHFLAERMSAQTVSVESSHVPMLSQPKKVLEVIRKAAIVPL